jgi:hypothetical protein
MGLQYKLRVNTGEITTALLSLGESARSMLAILRGAFRDLYSLHEDDAVTRLVRCASVATKIQASAEKLQANFEGLIEEAGAVLRLMSETCKLRDHERLVMQQRQLDIEASIERIKTKRTALELQRRKLETTHQELTAAQARVDERVFTQAIGIHIATAFGRGMDAGFTLDAALPELGSELAAALAQAPGINPARKEAVAASAAAELVKSGLAGSRRGAEDKAAESAAITATYVDQKSEYLDILKDLQNQEREAADAMIEHARQLGSAPDNDELASSAIVSLHHAVTRLEQIVATLAEHKRLWSEVGTDYARLAQTDLRTTVEQCMQRSRAERIEAYSDPRFQLYMLSVAARWHALERIAGEYRSAIQAAHTKMGRTYTSNPTIEETRARALALQDGAPQLPGPIPYRRLS